MGELILIEILAGPAEQSRGRHRPRAVKRKMSNFPTKARAAPARAHIWAKPNSRQARSRRPPTMRTSRVAQIWRNCGLLRTCRSVRW